MGSYTHTHTHTHRYTHTQTHRHTHTHTHTLRGGLYPSAAPCSATPRDPPSPGPRARCRARSVGVVTARRSAQGGGRLARRDGVAPPLRLAFLPAPPTLGRNYGGPARGRRAHLWRISPPPFLIFSLRAVGTATCAAPAGFGAGRGSPLCYSAHTASRGN